MTTETHTITTSAEQLDRMEARLDVIHAAIRPLMTSLASLVAAVEILGETMGEPIDETEIVSLPDTGEFPAHPGPDAA